MSDSVVPPGGQPLDGSTRSFFEQRFGSATLDNVRIHQDADAAALARGFSADAFAIGPHIVFARDRYHPDNADGRDLLAHELAHVVQQGSGAAPPMVQRAPGDTSNFPTQEEIARSEAAVTELVSGYGDVRDISAVGKNVNTPGPDRVFVVGRDEGAVLLHVDAKLSIQPSPVMIGEVSSFATELRTGGAGLRTLLDDARASGIITQFEYELLTEDARMGIVIEKVAGFGSVSGISQPLAGRGVTYSQGQQAAEIRDILVRRQSRQISAAASRVYKAVPKDPRTTAKTAEDVFAEFEKVYPPRPATPQPPAAAAPPATVAEAPSAPLAETPSAPSALAPIEKPPLTSAGPSVVEPKTGVIGGVVGKGLLAYGAYGTLKRLWRAWGTDKFEETAWEEGLTWAGGLINPGIGLGVSFAFYAAEAIAEALPALVEAFKEMGSLATLPGQIGTSIFFFPVLLTRARLDVTNWDLRSMSEDLSGPAVGLGDAIWRVLQGRSLDDFRDAAARPLRDLNLPYDVVGPCADALARQGLLPAATGAAARQMLLDRTPLGFVQLLESAAHLRYVRDPTYVANEQLGSGPIHDPRTLERARVAATARAKLDVSNWDVTGAGAPGIAAFGAALWKKLESADEDTFITLSLSSISSLGLSEAQVNAGAQAVGLALFPLFDPQETAAYVRDFVVNKTPQELVGLLIEHQVIGLRTDPAKIAKAAVEAVSTGYQPW